MKKLTVRANGMLVLRAAALAACTAASESAAGWGQTNYAYRKAIVVSAGAVSGAGDLTNFPVLVSLSDADLAWTNWGGHVTSATGADIVFTGADGTNRLDHEVELYGTNGQLVAWVRVPALGGSADTRLYMYYGDPEVAGPQEDPPNVWNADYMLVNHMKDSPAGAVHDSTANDNDATAGGGMDGSDLVTGRIGLALDLDGTDDYLAVAHSASIDFGDEDFTVSWWDKCSTNENNARAFNKGNSANPGVRYEGYWKTGYGLVFTVDDDSVKSEAKRASSATSDGAWHQWAMQRKTASNKLYIFLDGASHTNATDGTAGITNACDLYIGDGLDNGAALFGVYKQFAIDEFRISDTALSAEWLATGYTNQAAPGSFYTVGEEQEYGVESGTLYQF